MKFYLIIFLLINTNLSFAEDIIEEARRRGGSQFAKCYFCHSLKPDINMTGPSLANLWNAKAASVLNFKLYSDSLKKSGLTWNESTLLKWLTKPSDLVHDTTMTYKFDGDTNNLKNLIEFLKIAMKPNGYDTVIKNKYILKEFADGQLPKSAKEITNENKIDKIELCDSVFTIFRKTKVTTKHWEDNINLKIASDTNFSQSQEIRIIPTGSLGDRFLIIFPNLESIKKNIKPCLK